MDEVSITIDWIRHGFSCANILQHASVITNILRPMITSDASLTNIGVDQAIILNGKVVNDYDIICCSHLRRAMETALYGFNNPEKKQTLFVIPYVSEVRHGIARILGIDRENQSLGLSELENHWNQIKSQFNFDVDFSIVKNSRFSDYDHEDYDKFTKLVLPEIISIINKNQNINKKDYRIAIVSHSHFIKQHIVKNHNIKNMKELKNTEIWREQFNYNINKDNTGKILNYVKPEICNEQTCRIYHGSSPDCGEFKTDRCKKYQHTLYNKIVPDVININKCEIKNVQQGGFSNYRYIKYKQQ